MDSAVSLQTREEWSLWMTLLGESTRGSRMLDKAYQMDRALHYNRLWKDSIPDQSSRVSESKEPPGWLDVALSLEREIRILNSEVVSLRTTVSHITKERTRRGGEGTY